MKLQIFYLIVFLVINFGGLAIGNYLMNNGPQSNWYIGLNKAPWTPPGWVFGAAWTLIMICFSIYLAKQFTSTNQLKFISLIFLIEFILNVSWNYIFFSQHWVLVALIVIVLLTALIFYYFFGISEHVGKLKFLLLPYMIWLCIATSLNMYVLIHN